MPKNRKNRFRCKTQTVERVYKKYCSSGSIPGTEKIPDATSRCLSDRCAQNTASRCCLINEKLTFAAYDKIGGAGPRSTQVSYNRKPNAIVSLGKLRLRAANCGSILIEFAICMPILIILLFYINDVVRLKRHYSQTEFVAQQMANILQNISQKREGADRKITLPDIRYAASLAFLSMFPGTTNFRSGPNSDLGYTAMVYVFCIKGNRDSTASVLWFQRFSFAEDTPRPSSVRMDVGFPGRSNVKVLTDASPSEIYPTLKINPDEIKIIVECSVFYQHGDRYGFSDGRSSAQVSPSQAFGLHLYKLSPPKVRAGSNACLYFHSAVIFTPKPGLFDATAPAEHN